MCLNVQFYIPLSNKKNEKEKILNLSINRKKVKQKTKFLSVETSTLDQTTNVKRNATFNSDQNIGGCLCDRYTSKRKIEENNEK